MKTLALTLTVLICCSFVSTSEKHFAAANSNILIHLKYSVSPIWEKWNDKDGPHYLPYAGRPTDGWTRQQAYVVVLRNNVPSDTLYLPVSPSGLFHKDSQSETGEYYLATTIDNDAFYTFDLVVTMSGVVDGGAIPYTLKPSFGYKVFDVSM